MGLARARKRRKDRGPGRPSGAARRQLILEVVRTDSAFSYDVVGSTDRHGWVGRCFYCGRRIYVTDGGESSATLEHIRPLKRGGTNDLENLALACKGCNEEKGRNADRSKPDEYFDELLLRRQERWREPEEGDGVP